MFKKTIVTTFLGLALSTPIFAGTMGERPSNPFTKVYVGGYGGYGNIMGDYKNDGNFAQGRFAIGIDAKAWRQWNIGGEIGIQSGNTMRLKASSLVVDPITGIYPQATLKPLLDLLLTVKGHFSAYHNCFYSLKGGIAYRQLQLNDRTSTYGDGTSNVTGEFQAGLGHNLTEHLSLTAFYQGIYSNSNTGLYLNDLGNTPIKHIPTQQAGFFGVEYTF